MNFLDDARGFAAHAPTGERWDRKHGVGGGMARVERWRGRLLGRKSGRDGSDTGRFRGAGRKRNSGQRYRAERFLQRIPGAYLSEGNVRSREEAQSDGPSWRAARRRE